jgi:hypothetical protein
MKINGQNVNNLHKKMHKGTCSYFWFAIKMVLIKVVHPLKTLPLRSLNAHYFGVVEATELRIKK